VKPLITRGLITGKIPIMPPLISSDSPHDGENSSRRVRMIDIARAAGVSRASVSHVLNGKKAGNVRLSDETAARIRDIAREMRFLPSHAARQLAGKPSSIIGTLAKTWSGQTESRVLSWLNQLSASRGFKILAWESQADGLDKFVEECQSWNIDGLVFVAHNDDDTWPMVAKALARLPRVVSILGNPGIPSGHTVEIDADWGREMAGRGANPRLTTVDFDLAEIVGRALDLLGEIIARPDEQRPRSIFVKPKLVRESTSLDEGHLRWEAVERFGNEVRSGERTESADARPMTRPAFPRFVLA
jgi:DNA-binding LacI/PurR family transcriptional regulator